MSFSFWPSCGYSLKTSNDPDCSSREENVGRETAANSSSISRKPPSSSQSTRPDLLKAKLPTYEQIASKKSDERRGHYKPKASKRSSAMTVKDATARTKHAFRCGMKYPRWRPIDLQGKWQQQNVPTDNEIKQQKWENHVTRLLPHTDNLFLCTEAAFVDRQIIFLHWQIIFVIFVHWQFFCAVRQLLCTGNLFLCTEVTFVHWGSFCARTNYISALTNCICYFCALTMFLCTEATFVHWQFIFVHWGSFCARTNYISALTNYICYFCALTMFLCTEATFVHWPFIFVHWGSFCARTNYISALTNYICYFCALTMFLCTGNLFLCTEVAFVHWQFVLHWGSFCTLTNYICALR